jgi:ribosomal protein S20
MTEEKKEAPAPGGAPAAKKEGKTRTPSAKKRDIQSKNRNVQNRAFRAKVLTAIRAFENAISKGDKGVMKQKLDLIHSLMDKGVKTGKFKQNKASRTKSRLQKKIAKA